MTVEPSPEQPNLHWRVSDAERQQAADRLHQSLTDGRITVGELDDRLARVYAAKTYADLAEPLADLVPDPFTDTALVVPRETPAKEVVELRAGLGGIERKGRWVVPRRLHVTSGLGSVQLDFTEAELPGSNVEIQLDLGGGSAHLIVPEGASADVDEFRTSVGSVRCRVPGRPEPGGVHFKVSGRSSLGSVTVRYRWRWRKGGS